MSGLQEILVIVVLVLLVFFIPRMLPRKSGAGNKSSGIEMSGKMRMGLAASAVYLTIGSGILQPWKKDVALFVYAGIVPVAMGWLLVWVYRGIKKK